MTNLRGARILIVGMHYWPESTGNAPYTTAMAEYLAAQGASVDVVTGIPHYPAWRVMDARYRRGLRWYESHNDVRITRLRHWVPRRPNALGRALMELTFVVQATPAVWRERSDIVIAVTPMLSATAAATLGRRNRALGVLVQDLTGNAATESGTASRTLGRAVARAEYALLGRSSLVGVVAERFRDTLSGNGVAAARIVHLPNFTHVQGSELSPGEARAALGWPDSQFLAVHTGNIGRKQGLEVFVDAARLSMETGAGIDFALVGDGNQREQMVRRGGGVSTLRMVPPISERDYPLALAAADALVLCERPGVREMSLPSKLTSYAVSSRPVVAAVEPGGTTHEVLSRYGAAELVDTGSPEALLAALCRVRREPQRACELVVAAATLGTREYGRAAALERYARFAGTLLDSSLSAGRRSS